MKQLKIRKDLWDKIVKGEKQYEFRKLEKGLTTGTYEFVSMNVKQCKECIAIRPYFNEEENWICNECERETYGTAKLTFLMGNPLISKYSEVFKPKMWVNDTEYVKECELDEDTYNFVKENYIDKGIDFICYKISEVKNYE